MHKRTTQLKNLDEFFTARTKAREANLFSLGFSKGKYGFSFKDLHVIDYNIQNMNDYDWSQYMSVVEPALLNLKKEMNLQITDKDKLTAFVHSLGNITGPELKGEKERTLLEGVLYFIGQGREYLKEEIALLK